MRYLSLSFTISLLIPHSLAKFGSRLKYLNILNSSNFMILDNESIYVLILRNNKCLNILY